jgi:Fe-S-cluster containining protein
MTGFSSSATAARGQKGAAGKAAMNKNTTYHPENAAAVTVTWQQNGAVDQPAAATAREKEPLPARTEFGFARTECACANCASHCRVVPGYLLPADVERIGRHLGYTNPLSFAAQYLLASPGATVVQAGQLRQLPTLVPRRQANGACLFLDDDSRCRIHAVAPFGCAFFDSHLSAEEADQRSQHGLREIARLWANPKAHLYPILWRILDATTRRAVPPAEARLLGSRGEAEKRR